MAGPTLAFLALLLALFARASAEPRRPAILPLYLSQPKPQPQLLRRDFEGRRLQKSDRPSSSNARMRLHDDLLSNGYYTTRLRIGTPPQEFALIVDTGSTVTYVPCADCEQCGKHQDPRFQPNASSTYEPLKCSTNCNCDDEGVQCTYERRYAEMSSSSGVLAEDILSFGGESELAPQRAVFGCETMETGDLYSQRADGIMGLGRGRLSVMDQLVDKGVIGNSFSLCYGGMGIGGGAMVLGDIPSPPEMVFSHSDPYRSPYYNIDLKEIHVAGKPLKVTSKVFDRKHGTVLDSGTTYAYLPGEAFHAFKDAIFGELHSLKKVHGPDPNYNDICFSGAGRDINQISKFFPKVDMVFGNGQKLSLAPENYLFRHTKMSGAYCLGIFQNADETTLLGGIVVRNTLVTYDRQNNKVGFWKTNCSELWKGLNNLSPPPSPSFNTTTQIPPTIAPVASPPSFSPDVGEFQIGLISFYMMLGVNKSANLNFTELIDFIAHELDVQVSQVHLSNLKFKGNYSVIRWAIFPADSGDYFSNTTAMTILARLKDHHMQLPEKFGGYKLVELKVEPQKERSWWKQHLWIMAVGIVVALFAVLLLGGTWYFWRCRKQEIASYEPVNVAVPERELQPL